MQTKLEVSVCMHCGLLKFVSFINLACLLSGAEKWRRNKSRTLASIIYCVNRPAHTLAKVAVGACVSLVWTWRLWPPDCILSVLADEIPVFV